MRETIPELLREAAERQPAERFLERSGRWLTYYDFRELAMEIGAGLLEEELGRGKHVALCLPPGPDLVLCWMGLASIGAVAVLADRTEPLERHNVAACIGAPGPGKELRLQDLEGTHGCGFWPEIEESDAAALIVRASGPIRRSHRDYVLAARDLASREEVQRGAEVSVPPSSDPDTVMALTLGTIAAGGILVFR